MNNFVKYICKYVKISTVIAVKDFTFGPTKQF